jgi:hypothetical protein
MLAARSKFDVPVISRVHTLQMHSRLYMAAP